MAAAATPERKGDKEDCYEFALVKKTM